VHNELGHLDVSTEEKRFLVTGPFPSLGTEREDRSILSFHCLRGEQGPQVMEWKCTQDEEIIQLVVLYTWRDLQRRWQVGRGQQTRSSDGL